VGPQRGWILGPIGDINKKLEPHVMMPTTILIDESPRCVVRPTDTKDLNRFIRKGKTFLLAENPVGKITHRTATEVEQFKWREALALHLAWGGDDEGFFGIPLQAKVEIKQE
jgi:hypothetical protein